MNSFGKKLVDSTSLVLASAAIGFVYGSLLSWLWTGRWTPVSYTTWVVSGLVAASFLTLLEKHDGDEADREIEGGNEPSVTSPFLGLLTDRILTRLSWFLLTPLVVALALTLIAQRNGYYDWKALWSFWAGGLIFALCKRPASLL